VTIVFGAAKVLYDGVGRDSFKNQMQKQDF
jgi:hypothetical protein